MDTQPFDNKMRQAAVQAAFDLLHRGLQRQLWKRGWTRLRPLQVDAIRLVLQSVTVTSRHGTPMTIAELQHRSYRPEL